MNIRNEEIQKIIVSVFELTGCKMTADDPVVAMMLLQRREMVEHIQQSYEQQQAFLENFVKQSESLLIAAAEFQEIKQQLLAEILQSNAKELAQQEKRLFESVGKRLIEFNRNEQNLFFKRLKIGVTFILLVQTAILIAVFFVRFK